MPLLVLYRGRPVRKRRRVAGGGLKLILYSPRKGKRGKRLIVSDAQWQRHGTVQFLPHSQMPNLRKLAAIRASH